MAWTAHDKARRHAEVVRKDREQRLNQVVTTVCGRCGRRKTGRLRATRAWFAEHAKGCRG